MHMETEYQILSVNGNYDHNCMVDWMDEHTPLYSSIGARHKLALRFWGMRDSCGEKSEYPQTYHVESTSFDNLKLLVRINKDIIARLICECDRFTLYYADTKARKLTDTNHTIVKNLTSYHDVIGTLNRLTK